MLVYFMDTWSILRPFDLFYDHLVYFVLIWNIFPRFWYIVPSKNLATLSNGADGSNRTQTLLLERIQ
jgi:hypothetical protein